MALSLCLARPAPTSSFFFFNDTATTEIYTLSLHDALPISSRPAAACAAASSSAAVRLGSHRKMKLRRDRKSTRLNSSHQIISYAVFCLKKKKNTQIRSPACPLHTPRHHPRAPRPHSIIDYI